MRGRGWVCGLCVNVWKLAGEVTSSIVYKTVLATSLGADYRNICEEQTRCSGAGI